MFELDLHDWSQPHLPWRLIFTNLPIIPAAVIHEDWFIRSMSRWQEFSQQVQSLCKHQINIRGSWTIYFAAKEDVAMIKLMFAEHVYLAQQIEEFLALGGQVTVTK